MIQEENEVLENSPEQPNPDLPEEPAATGNGSNIGKLEPVEIVEEMRRAYLDYAMSVIVDRALPDVRDGLKPVHRRIMYAMNEIGLTYQAKYRKSATVVGEVLGKYHPHGDGPVYGAMVRLAQNFAMRYMLVDGQGNFGSVDGDPAAAMRYTEARLAKISKEILADIDKNTVNFIPNFDGTRQEPLVLPSKIPNLLANGGSGIAVGMATNIPPHNLNELIDALIYMIGKSKPIEKIIKELSKTAPVDVVAQEVDGEVNIATPATLEEKPDETVDTTEVFEKARRFYFESNTTVEDLIQIIKGPDFPTGGSIYDQAEIIQAYATGKGRVVMRAKLETEEERNGRISIIVNEIPYQVNKAQLVSRIADLVKEKKLEGISDLRDESDRKGMRVVIELKRDARPQQVINFLYKHTPLQLAFNVNLVALVDGVPQTLSLKTILEEFVKHRLEVVTRRTEFELEAAKRRAHILEGLKIALDHLDEVIQTIRTSADSETARTNLMTKFGLSEIQATAILDMQLRRLAALERKKLEDEYIEVKKLINHLESLLADRNKILGVIKDELIEIKKDYGDPRRTRVYPQPIGEFNEEDLIPKEQQIITITETGYIKRSPTSTFRTQNRGGRGVAGMTMKEEDTISQILSASTHDNILFFTNKGRVYQLKVYDLPEGSRQSKGQAIINLINIEQGEQVTTILTYSPPKRAASSALHPKQASDGSFLFLTTRGGTVKKTALKEFENIRRNGIIAIKLTGKDELKWVKLTSGRDDIIIATSKGMSIKFSESDARPMGRDTMGVMGIRLGKDDQVISMDIADPKQYLLTVSERGFGKKSSIADWPIQKRGGVGVKCAEVKEKNGKIVAAMVVGKEDKDLIITSRAGQVIKLPIKDVPVLQRQTQGVILIRLARTDDSVAAVTTLVKEKEIEEKLQSAEAVA